MRKILYAIMIIGGLASCSEKEDLSVPVPDPEETVLSINATVLTSMPAKMRSLQSRVYQGKDTGPVMNPNLASSSEIGVFVYEADGFNAYAGNQNNENLKWVNENNRWSYWLGDQPATRQFSFSSAFGDVYAYFPYEGAENITSSGNPDVFRIEDVASGYTDYLYGFSKGHNAKNPQVALVLEHALAMISFTFTKDGYSGPCQVERITLKNLPASAAMRLDTGIEPALISGSTTLDLKGFVNNVYAEYSSWISPENKSHYNFASSTIGKVDVSQNPVAPLLHALVLPQTPHALKPLNSDGTVPAETIYATIIIDNLAYDVSLVLTNGWEAGKKHTYNLKMKGSNQLVVSSVSVSQWEEGEYADIEI